MKDKLLFAVNVLYDDISSGEEKMIANGILNKGIKELREGRDSLQSEINRLHQGEEEIGKRLDVCKKELWEHKLLLSMVEKLFLKYDVTINADKFPDGNRYMVLLEETKGGVCITRERHYGKTIQEAIFNAGKGE